MYRGGTFFFQFLGKSGGGGGGGAHFNASARELRTSLAVVGLPLPFLLLGGLPPLHLHWHIYRILLNVYTILQVLMSAGTSFLLIQPCRTSA